MVFPQAHIVTETHNAIHIEFGELFDSVWISELVDYWFMLASMKVMKNATMIQKEFGVN